MMVTSRALTSKADGGVFLGTYNPFILATEASQVFFLEDTKFGSSWRVVQEFGHRHIFDVEESDGKQPIHEQV